MAAAATVGGALEFLAYHRRSVPAASFVFVVSDFLVAPTLETWERALDRGWDVVPVVVQDPIWEQSFPDIDGIGMPLVDEGGRVRIVRLRRGESRLWRTRHEERLASLLAGMRSLGIEPVVVSSADRARIFDAFVTWSAERDGAGRLVRRAVVIACRGRRARRRARPGAVLARSGGRERRRPAGSSSP